MASTWADAEDSSDELVTQDGPVAAGKTKKPQRRKRAPASGGNLDPGMQCPVGREQLQASEAAASLGLCGPSELRHSLPRTCLELVEAPQLGLPPAQSADDDLVAVLRVKLRYVTQAAGVELLRARAGRTDIAELVLSFLSEKRPLTETETGGLMHIDAGSANLDLFFQAVPQPRPEANCQLQRLVEQAWAESPQTCLRQIFLLGASREGKQDRYLFYDAMLWLWEQQPATVLANLHLVPETNYWKGLLELLARVCEGPRRSLERDQALYDKFVEGAKKLPARGSKKYPGQGWKPGSRLELACEALKRYDEDPLYRALFERTGQLFADQLREDTAAMRAGERIGLCAKWCPLLYHSFDRRTLVCESIARWLFPASLPEFAGTSEREYAYRARDKLRHTLSRLKEYTKSPERLMCQGRWSEIAYKAVPAACMKINSKHFLQHDAKRFLKHVDGLASGKCLANVGALQPHEILVAAQEAAKEFDPIKPALVQAQWEALVAQVRAAGALDGCIAICDVSGSMGCEAAPNVTCMDVAVSLSLLLAEVAQGPYARRLITFSENPVLVDLPATKQLAELSRFTRSLPWGMSTNFFKVFDMLLPMQPPPKRIFVFSDMQFASAGGQATDFQRARAIYGKAGLAMPEVVFWNLRSHWGAPAAADDEGVALVSGFSSVMMRLLLQEGAPEPPSQQAAAPEDAPTACRMEVEDQVPQEVEEENGAFQEAEDEEELDWDREEQEQEQPAEQVEDEETDADEPPGQDANADDKQPGRKEHELKIKAAQVMSAQESDSEPIARQDPFCAEPRSAKQLQALGVLAKALSKPLLQRLRVVHCVEEAVQLFRGPQQSVSGPWTVLGPEAAPDAVLTQALEPAKETGSSRWTTVSLKLGSLPCKEAVAAFIGRSVRALREEVQRTLRRELKACRRGVHVWLDVETQPLPAPRLESGEVKVTAKARVSKAKLQAALQRLPELVQPSIEEAMARAEQPKPGRARKGAEKEEEEEES